MTAVCEPVTASSGEIATEAFQEILDTQLAMLTKPHAIPSRIVLTGFMGAGKSTVGRLLAERLRWRFIDADDEVVRKAALPIADIFAKYGEFVFRRMETSAIAHALGERNAVIALGGGAVEVLANRLLLEQTPRTTVVHLHAPLPVLLARCHAQSGPQRPNLPSADERFQYRAPLYKRVAKLHLDTTDRRPDETVEELWTRLNLEGAGEA